VPRISRFFATRSGQRRGDRLADVTGEERNLRVGPVWWFMGQDVHGSREGVGFAARCGPPLLGSVHPVADLVRPPTDEHGACGRRDLWELAWRHEVENPVHCVTGTGNKAVEYLDLFTTTLPLISRQPPCIGSHWKRPVTQNPGAYPDIWRSSLGPISRRDDAVRFA
jgi:hypothetical protein